MATLDDLNLSESNVNELVLVRDAQGNEFVCHIKDLKPVSELTEEERKKCVRNVEPETR